MSRAKPCATCGHPKSRHRTRECRHTWQARGATFMGISTVTRWCSCPGYDTAGEQQKQAGNAVAVNVSAWLGRAAAQALDAA